MKKANFVYLIFLNVYHYIDQTVPILMSHTVR